MSDKLEQVTEVSQNSDLVLGQEMDMKFTHTYNDSDIQVLDGLEAVRKRPGMYIASTSSKGLHHLVWEIVDNGIDEAMAGYASTVTVTVDKDNIITVEDDGRGMPTGIHEKQVSLQLRLFSLSYTLVVNSVVVLIKYPVVYMV